MKYLIKLEDRMSGRKALIECPANMLLEELCVKIKLELHLPYTDWGYHCFQMHGKVYVPDGLNTVRGIWGAGPDDTLPKREYIQAVRDYPTERDLRSSESYRLNQVYTVLDSGITYIQNSSNGWFKVRCTLVARM